jgi:uncharacterized membrane protein YeaQ/YmgE (transglycosylase-associated protein family)
MRTIAVIAFAFLVGEIAAAQVPTSGKGWITTSSNCWRGVFRANYIHSNLFCSPQNNLRLSTGIVLRF